MTDEPEASGVLASFWQNVAKGAQNALELARVGRLSPQTHAPYVVVRRERVYKLRHYARSPSAPAVDAPLLLVPPLMVTAEIYDIDPGSSAVAILSEAGVDTWLVDFGTPEQEEGGLLRTLDDHIHAVNQALDHVRAHTGQDAHLAGYSQGGMFCYQTAAYRRSEGIKSLITFGSPVDIHLNTRWGNELATRFIDSTSGLFRMWLSAISSLPGQFSSWGFRVLSAGKEARRFVDFVAHLHDREALMHGESSRRFLHGEGFVAWPAPALRSFFEQFVVENRMSQGGFVIDGRTLSLADLTCPILYFVGERDEFARPASVHAIRDAAPHAPIFHQTLRAGHFGLVVGNMAMKHTWPLVMEWLRWREDKALRPASLHSELEEPKKKSAVEALEDALEVNFEEAEYNARLLFDTVKDSASALGRRAASAIDTVGEMVDNLRYQVPRLAKLERMAPDTPVSVGLVLSEQAAAIGQNTFFLWQGRAHTYADADRRVDNIVRGLIACGVKPRMRVGVVMHARPTYLSLVAALSRLGAVAVLINPDEARIGLADAFALAEVEGVVSDPEAAERVRRTFSGQVLVLGGGGGPRRLIEGVVDMEQIDPHAVVLPDGYTPNPGRAEDLALIMFTVGKDEKPRATKITNRRWAVAAYGAAAASTLTSKDTVYCCMPLDHAAGLLVSVGGALVGGARLALAPGFDARSFWADTRRYGASVVFYAGEMCRALVDQPSSAADRRNPVRLFAGSGMRVDVWKRMVERFNTAILEFYATTEGNAVLANVAGAPVGSLGKPLPGTVDMAIVAFDVARGELVKGPDGKLVRCEPDEPGMLIARVDSGHPMAAFDGYTDARESTRRLIEAAFEPGDQWFVTGDILRVDGDENHWFVDRAVDMVRTQQGPVATIRVEDILYELPAIRQAAVVGMQLPERSDEVAVAALVLRPGDALDVASLSRLVNRRLQAHARPAFVRIVPEIQLTPGYRPMKQPLKERGLDAAEPGLLRYDQALQRYVPASAAPSPRAEPAEDAR